MSMEEAPVNGNHESYEQLRALSTSVLLERYRFAKMAGITFDGDRDEYKLLGYHRYVTTKMYRDEYERGGIAGRIVDTPPNATWRGDFEVIESDDPKVDTEFEKAWTLLNTKHRLKSKLHRVDKLSRLSTYAVLLIGASGDLRTEL